MKSEIIDTAVIIGMFETFKLLKWGIQGFKTDSVHVTHNSRTFGMSIVFEGDEDISQRAPDGEKGSVLNIKCVGVIV